MTIVVPAWRWQPLARRLADDLDADGDLHTPGWRDALLAVPRHEFIPRYYLQDREARPLRWTTHQPHDTQSTQRWLDLVYSLTTLVTNLAARGVQAPGSSSIKPDLMIRMLEALDVTDGMRVLEIAPAPATTPHCWPTAWAVPRCAQSTSTPPWSPKPARDYPGSATPRR